MLFNSPFCDGYSTASRYPYLGTGICPEWCWFLVFDNPAKLLNKQVYAKDSPESEEGLTCVDRMF